MWTNVSRTVCGGQIDGESLDDGGVLQIAGLRSYASESVQCCSVVPAGIDAAYALLLQESRSGDSFFGVLTLHVMKGNEVFIGLVMIVPAESAKSR